MCIHIYFHKIYMYMCIHINKWIHIYMVLIYIYIYIYIYVKSMKRKKMVCVTHFYAHQVLVASIFDFGIRIDNLFGAIFLNWIHGALQSCHVLHYDKEIHDNGWPAFKENLSSCTLLFFFFSWFFFLFLLLILLPEANLTTWTSKNSSSPSSSAKDADARAGKKHKTQITLLCKVPS